MTKLFYRTKPPKKGWVFNESFMTHDFGVIGDIPSKETQREAMELVGKTLRELIEKLDILGYDPTKVRFQIYYKVNGNDNR